MPAAPHTVNLVLAPLCARRGGPNHTITRIVVFVFWADIEEEADVASRLGVMYMSTMFVGVICLQTAIPAGVKERIVFYREQV